jgi:hypothetical protein
MAPVKPSTAPEVNDLPNRGPKDREFCRAEVRTETNIVVAKGKGKCEPAGGGQTEDPLSM